MAGLAHDQLYSNEPQSSLHPQYWPKGTGEEDDDAVLDDHILDSSSFDVTTMDSAPRRESFASSASLVSPRQNVWPEFAYNNDATPTGSMSTPAPQFLEHAAVNPYSQTGPPHYPNYGTHMASWHPQGDTGSDASNMAFVAFASDLDNIKPEESFNKEMPPPPQHSMYGGLPIASVPDFNQYAASAASPQWSTSSSDNVEKIPRSGQFQSPSFNHNQLHLRRDGVRKKNARFEIPAGRDVNTIDAMINSTDPNDEETIKELKQQKRLLRNRQAAYRHLQHRAM